MPRFDVDVTGDYLLFKDAQGEEILFLGERHDQPHFHGYNEGTGEWYKVNYGELSAERRGELKKVKRFPTPLMPRNGQFEATNEQVAKMLVFFRKPDLSV